MDRNNTDMVVFAGVSQMRATGYVAGPDEGTVLMWKTDVLKLHSWEPFTFSDYLLPSETISAAQERVDGAVIALLEHTHTKRMLVAVCTHLFWNPNYPDVKV